MADQQHIHWLFEGREEWNARRDENEFTPDFSGVDLYQAFRDENKLNSDGDIPLAGFDLRRANFADSRLSTLQALLFRHAFWDMDLSRFVRVPSPWTAGVVAAGRDRRDPLGPVRGGGGLAECGRVHRIMHDPRRRVTGAGSRAGVHDVRVANSLAASLVRASRVPGTRGDARRGMAQERPVRPLPVVRCPAIGQPSIEPLRRPVLVRELHVGGCLRVHRTIRNRYAVE